MLITATDVAEKLILIILFLLSVWSIAIMIDRRRVLRIEKEPDDLLVLKKSLEDKNVAHVKNWAEKNSSFIARALREAFHAPMQAEAVDRAVSSFVKFERVRLEKGLAILATLGANAPFVGLFGTVLGIIRAFAYLGTQSGSAAVMSGVSQALYATALGLFVAIPAVVAYNIYAKNIRDLIGTVESLRDLYISRFTAPAVAPVDGAGTR